jgi:cytochrome c-type biogenesis protein CcmF
MNGIIPSIKKEESASSREFWMFIGSLVILISAIIITAQTSIPVYNKIFGWSIAPPPDVEFFYNRIQIFIAILIGVLTATGQYLKYKETSKHYFMRKIGWPFLISAVAAGLILYFGNINYDKYGIGYLSFIWIAIACSVFAIIANLAYLWIGIRGNLRLSGPSVAHFGFAMMLLGILISSSKKEILSYNTNGIFVPIEENKITGKAGENYTLPKEIKMDMGKYWVTYSGDSSHPKKSQKYFKIHFIDKETKEEFTLKPNAFINYKGNEGLSANPDARHYWNYDVFAYITALADPSRLQDTTSFTTKTLKIGDSVFLSKKLIVLDTIQSRDSLPEELFGKDGKLFEARFSVFDPAQENSLQFSMPKLAIAKGEAIGIPDTVSNGSLILKLNKYDGRQAEVGIKEPNAIQDFLTLKVYKFPFINLLWLGTLIMALGFIISMVRRIQVAKN